MRPAVLVFISCLVVGTFQSFPSLQHTFEAPIPSIMDSITESTPLPSNMGSITEPTLSEDAGTHQCRSTAQGLCPWCQSPFEISNLKPEAKIWREKQMKDGEKEFIDVSETEDGDPLDEDYAIVVRQLLDDRNVLSKSRLTINSPHILTAFRHVVGSYPTLPVDFTSSFDMESPFKVLFHYWEDLDEYRQNLKVGGDERQHVDVLLHYMEKYLGSEKRKIDAMIRKGQVDYSRLWAIFRPKDLMLTYARGEPWMLQLTKVVYEENKNCGPYLEVHCTYTASDGTDVGRAREVVQIFQKESFGQENPADIVDLPIFPRKFAKQAIKDSELIARGRRYLDLQGVHVKHYEGLAEYLKSPPPSYYDPKMDSFDLTWLPYTETARIVIDTKTFLEDNMQESISKVSSIDDFERSLCPPFVPGYSTNRKQWCRFYLSHISSVQWKPDPFASLILPKQQLHLVRALVSSHRFPENVRNQMEQKGKGLVVLLHGPPGSGKTLTAECAAEESHRALFSVSMSELNKYNSVYDFEDSLKSVLRLATMWKAVILFDEADVFLESRGEQGSNDSAAERNALVAVFLRHLEYFSGIVFLTTNRVQVFDTAMKSRIHLALGYSAPESDSLIHIWANALAKIPEHDRDIDLKTAPKLLAEPLNGREITNSVNTAYTLARFQELPLKLEHIETVLNVRRDFEESLRRMRDGGEQAVFPVRRGSVLDEDMGRPNGRKRGFQDD